MEDGRKHANEEMELTGVVAPKDEDDYDRRPQRRRYEEPLSSKIRKQFLSLAESPLKRVEDEIHFLAKTIVDNWEEAEVKEGFFEVVECMVREQSFKVPFVAAVVLCINGMKGEVVREVGERMGSRLNDGIERGEWRDVKLCLKFLGGLQGVLEGEGVWIVLQDLLTKAVDLQKENNEEVSFPCALGRFAGNEADGSRLLVPSWSRSSCLRSRISWLRQQPIARREQRA